MALEQTAPLIRIYLVADLKCYLCGGVLGSIESEQQKILPRRVLFREVGEKEGHMVDNWRQLRCQRCGGPTFLDDADVVTRRVERVDWIEDRPRRGRPPKRLLEQRRREQEAAQQSQAA